MSDLTRPATYVCKSSVDFQCVVGQYVVTYGFRPHGQYQYDWGCSCPGFRFHGKCKHIEAAKETWCNWNWEMEPFVEVARDEQGNLCRGCS